MRLTEQLRAVQKTIEEADELIRRGWDVAVDLNKVRRECARCEAAGGLSEAIGFYQGLLNRWRHNVQEALKAVDSMKTVASDLEAERRR